MALARPWPWPQQTSRDRSRAPRAPSGAPSGAAQRGARLAAEEADLLVILALHKGCVVRGTLCAPARRHERCARQPRLVCARSATRAPGGADVRARARAPAALCGACSACLVVRRIAILEQGGATARHAGRARGGGRMAARCDQRPAGARRRARVRRGGWRCADASPCARACRGAVPGALLVHVTPAHFGHSRGWPRARQGMRPPRESPSDAGAL